jgi:hypothetical protein
MAEGSLGEELGAVLENITALMIATDSASERSSLSQLQANIAGRLQVFVDGLANEALPEYKAAAAALNEANEEAEAAKKDLDRVANTIKRVADAIDRLDILAAKVTG